MTKPGLGPARTAGHQSRAAANDCRGHPRRYGPRGPCGDIDSRRAGNCCTNFQSAAGDRRRVVDPGNRGDRPALLRPSPSRRSEVQPRRGDRVRSHQPGFRSRKYWPAGGGTCISRSVTSKSWKRATSGVSCSTCWPAIHSRPRLILGHPGKLAKLAVGQWDTHSARSPQAIEYLGRLYREVLGRPAPESLTAEGLFAALESGSQPVFGGPSTGDVGRIGNPSSHQADLPDGLPIRPTGKPILSRSHLLQQVGPPAHSPAASQRDILGDALARRIRQAITSPKDDLAIRSLNARDIPSPSCEVAVFLVNMAGERLGSDGDLTPWQ